MRTNCESTSVLRRVVTASLTSSTGAIAVMTPESGLLTTYWSLFSCHFVLIDKESLPTGIEIPKSIEKFDKASTPFLKAKSSIFSPEAAIQFADTWIWSIPTIGAETILVSASAIAIRIDAAGLLIAKVGFSPIVTTSPEKSVNERKLIEKFDVGTCQGPTNWSLAVMPPTVLSPIVIKNDLHATVGCWSTWWIDSSNA